MQTLIEILMTPSVRESLRPTLALHAITMYSLFFVSRLCINNSHRFSSCQAQALTEISRCNTDSLVRLPGFC